MLKLPTKLKVMLAIFIANAIENTILLFFFGFSLTKQSIIGILIFTALLTSILSQINVLKD